MLKSVFPQGETESLKAAMGSSGVPIEDGTVPPAYRVPGRTFLLGYGLADNYFNWTLRYASRVAQYQAMPDVVQLAVPMPRKRYVPETLEFLGVPQHEVIHLEAPMIFDRLVLVSPMAFGRYEISPLITETLRDHPRVRELWRRPKRKIYIPRRNVGMRRVVNEPGVEEALRKLGFEVFDNAEHPVREQVRAFRDAALIVSPHGAGLSNIAYCDPGTPVVELVPEGYDQGVTSYRSLADLFGLPYTQLFAKEAKRDRKGNRCNSDIEIDVEELVQTLGAIAA
jgi:capsular polysaccharide biosynthesis protein